ncbi:DNA polymerase III subunit delta [Actibacterium sp. XHP0104]|uniref:DNA polymerase III subunit delta n=1 Tax=Actibacterium sp. XHP0104 TaxID=2984335 RepID=UPI0021E9252F|nr:DNA polymerase III subunit delta [Actibacterium sp. XHP0104]MCV2881969.1 DNA polymerase III subunit delta [Actibacterium sp. XHP0104]
MKLTGRDANRYFARPEPNRMGLLIFGADAMRVALKRQEVIAALIGPQGEEEMRLTRINASELRSDPAALSDAIKAQSFFPGPRVAFVEDATDALAPTIKAAIEDWQEGDAQVIVTAKQLTAKSALRKIFETHPNAYAAGIYDDPPSREEIEAELTRAGVRPDADAMAALTALSREIDPGDFRQTLEKLSLYKFQDSTPATAEDVAACAPSSTEADMDDVLHVVAEGRTGEVGPLIGKLESQGITPVSLCIGATRHFRALHAAAADPGGVSSGIARLRPPVFGPRRDRMARQASSWGMARLEQALAQLTDTDLQLRSTSRAPAMAVVERTLLRLASMARR